MKYLLALMLIAGCNKVEVSGISGAGNAVSDSEDSTFAFDLPAGSVVGPSGINSVTVSGTCPDSGTVQLSEFGGATATAVCTDGEWSTTMDFSGNSDGPIVVSAVLLDSNSKTIGEEDFTFNKDTLGPNMVIFSAPNTDSVITASNYIFSWGTTDQGSAGLRSSNRYKVEKFNNATCTGAAASTVNQNPNTYNYSSLSAGGYYSLRVTAYDAANNSSVPVCSSFILANPSVAFTAPSASAVLGAAGLNAVTVSGTCAPDGTVNISATGGITDTANCVGGVWTKSVDFTAASDGAVVVTADLLDAGAATIATETLNISVDTAGPNAPTFSAPSANVTIIGASYNFAWSTTDVGTAGLRATNRYQVETFAVAGCAGAPAATTTQNGATFPYGSLTNGNTYSVRITAYDAVNNVSSTTCSDDVTVDTAAPTLALSDPTTSSTTHIRQVAADVAIASDTNAVKWCLSQTQTTAPASGAVTCTGGAGASSGWHTARPTTFSFTTGDALKTLYLWIADSSGTVLGTSVTDTITLDTTKPATPTIALSDPDTASTTNTNQSTLDIAITGDTDAVEWCILETLAADPNPTAPIFSDPCFVSTEPTDLVLAGRGVRKIHVYTKDVAENVSVASGTDTLDFPLPTVLILTGLASIPQWGCSELITVTQRDSYGLDSPGASVTTVTLTGDGAGDFYSDAGCTTTTTSVAIAIAEKTKTFYYKSGTIGALTFTAAGLTTNGTLNTAVEYVYLITSTAYYNPFTCGIVQGSLQCWGSNWNGTLGDGTGTNRSYGRYVSGLTSQVTHVHIGERYVCSVVNGGAKCWGANWGNQIGTPGSSLVPIDIPSLTTGVRAVAASYLNTCVVHGESAKCWGNNDWGEVGDGTTTPRNVPTQVTGLTSGVTAITVGTYHACAIVNGGVKCWGDNGDGRLGNGSVLPNINPVDTNILTSGVTAISAGSQGTCAIKDGALYCWGDNYFGLMGDGTQIDKYEPTLVPGFNTGVTSVSVGTSHYCAVKNGAAFCWGYDSTGEVGAAVMDTGYLVPEAVTGLSSGVKSITAGGNTSCATLTNNEFRCWGNSMIGALGTGVPYALSVPNEATALGNSVATFSAGEDHACYITTTGDTKCFGSGPNGQLGNSNWVDSENPVFVTNGDGGVKVSAGYRRTCAIDTAGGAYCWGHGAYGALGVGDTDSYHDPRPVSGLGSGVTDISSSAYGYHTCAVVSGAVKCWGANYVGELGIAASTYEDEPVNSSILAGATDVETGGGHTCAIVSGAVKCWGYNDYGQLGDGSIISTHAPTTPIPAGATSLSLSDIHTCAVSTGDLYCWGANWYGGLGTGDFSNRLTATLIISGGVSKVVARGGSTCVLMTSGAVKCFGNNEYGELGNGNFTMSGVHQDVIGITASQPAVDIFAGPRMFCALFSDNSLKCWGSSQRGLTGDGETLLTNIPQTPILEGNPAKVVVSGPATSTSNVCSTAFTVTLKTPDDTPINAPLGGVVVDLTNGGTGTFYSDACITPVTSVTIPAGSNNVQFYYQAPTPLEVGIVVKSVNLVRSSMKHNALSHQLELEASNSSGHHLV